VGYIASVRFGLLFVIMHSKLRLAKICSRILQLRTKSFEVSIKYNTVS